MTVTKKKLGVMIFVFLITAGVSFAINWIAVTYCMENLKLFTAMILIAPMICNAVAALFLGNYMKWNWKSGIAVALVLMLISLGTNRMIICEAESYVSSMESKTHENVDEALMNELYAELDKQAYAYMLSQGLISEGEDIFAGQDFYDKDVTDEDSVKKGIVRSEMYVGIQKADPATELMGNVVTFLIAFGFWMVGEKIGVRRKKIEVEKKL